MAAGPAYRSALFAVGLALAVSACARGPGGDTAPEHGDQAVARVDGKTIWASDVKREAIAQGLIGQGEPLDMSSDTFRQMMDEVVDQRLLAAEAVRRKLDKDAVAQRKLESAHDRVLGDLLVDSTVADAVTENNIKGLYDEQQKLARRGVEIHARQIVLATPAEVEAVRKLVMAGGSFEALAMEKSRDAATRFNGGDLGYFTADVMPGGYEAALNGAKPGQLVGPVTVAGGYALVKVEDVREEQPVSLDAARPQIVRFLTYDRIRDLLETLRAKAKVETLIKAEAGGRKPIPPADAPKVAPQTPAAPTAQPKLKGAVK
ncbi:peptidylprolyl isomerase [Phenylobacterium sp.]|uniref:peptidylprolyl isomerase n=1 Tax=Phenylobacterium sp. TaxID=1871053 RepID=UPI0025DD7A0E|nr:peptidylprolyl isomerase [Phenylobacterium sp.]